MGKKKQGKSQDFELDSNDDYSDLDGGEIDFDGLSSNSFISDRDEIFAKDDRASARRKIERRHEMRALYSQFDDWDENDPRNEW